MLHHAPCSVSLSSLLSPVREVFSQTSPYFPYALRLSVITIVYFTFFLITSLILFLRKSPAATRTRALYPFVSRRMLINVVTFVFIHNIFVQLATALLVIEISYCVLPPKDTELEPSLVESFRRCRERRRNRKMEEAMHKQKQSEEKVGLLEVLEEEVPEKE